MARVYALMSEQLVLYVGSTIMTLKKREWSHRCKSNKAGSRDIPVDCIWEMKLLEECAVELRLERELYYYHLLKPLYNHNSPFGLDKEAYTIWKKTYHEANKEAIHIKQKAYHEANKEAIAIRGKKYREANKEAIAIRRKARYERKKLKDAEA